jgi:hypothetical protein
MSFSILNETAAGRRAGMEWIREHPDHDGIAIGSAWERWWAQHGSEERRTHDFVRGFYQGVRAAAAASGSSAPGSDPRQALETLGK